MDVVILKGAHLENNTDCFSQLKFPCQEPDWPKYNDLFPQ